MNDDDQNKLPAEVDVTPVEEVSTPEEPIQTTSEENEVIEESKIDTDSDQSDLVTEAQGEEAKLGEGEVAVGDPEKGPQESTASERASEDAPETPGGEQDPQGENEAETPSSDTPGARWYVIHTYSGHENRVAETLKQRVGSEGLEHKILEVLVPTQDKIEIRSGKKETVKEKIFPGYILVKMLLDDDAWLAVRTTQGVTSFVGMGNKPTPIPEFEVKTIVNFMAVGQQPTYKQIFDMGDTVKIVDGPFAEFIGKVDSIDKDRGKVRVLVSIFGRETPVELDFLQVQKL